MSGYCTFTATSCPSKRARWTCPIEALAAARGSQLSKSASGASPSSARTTLATISGAIAVLLACSVARIACASGVVAPGM